MSKAISLADKLNFTTPEELEEWLQDKPIEWAQVIAVRTALRVLPLVGQVFQNDDLSDHDKGQLTLLTFRACFISSAARRYASDDITVYSDEAARGVLAGFATPDAFAAPAIFAVPAAYAAVHINYANDAAGIAKDVIHHAANAVAFATRPVDTAAAATANTTYAVDAADIWISVSLDANWLLAQIGEAGVLAKRLLETRLWPQGELYWFNQERVEFKHLLMDQSEHHLVWINWYSNVIQGKSQFQNQKGRRLLFDLSPANEKVLTLIIAKQPNEFWEQDFAKVSEDISNWLEQARIEDAAERTLENEEQVESIEPVSTVTKNSESSTKSSKSSVDQHLLQVWTNIEAINSISAERLNSMPLKPNSGEALEDWNTQREILTTIEEKSAAISASIQAIEKHNDRSKAIEETTGLLDELFQELENFVRTNKKELVENTVRTSIPILLCGLANLVGASMVIATPVIFAMAGGKKIYDLLMKNKDKSDK